MAISLNQIEIISLIIFAGVGYVVGRTIESFIRRIGARIKRKRQSRQEAKLEQYEALVDALTRKIQGNLNGSKTKKGKSKK